ncbi:hypothetical protein H4R99_000850 [Coemansia sp. RSA 1722]|nr:hypothetical protein H4R99_000850 [Coemansia sp. RSA 1722]KAJ2638914.1 hypothetical protein GGF40_001317 [Coemansia sp. RSA 1286]
MSQEQQPEHAKELIGEYKLCPMEGSPGSYKNIQYMLVFRFQTDTTTTKAVDALRFSFNRLTELYPLVKGHRVTIDGKNAIIVDKVDLEAQRFFVHHETQLTVDELLKMRYSRNLWPYKTNTLLYECVENRERLISAAIVCLGDGCLISLSVSHMVADGTGVFFLLKQWASMCKQMLSNPLVIELLPEMPVNYNRQRFWSQLAQSPKDVHPYVDFVLQQNTDNNVGSLQHSFKVMCNTGAIALPETLSTRIIHLSAESIAKLGNDYNSITEAGHGRIHGVQLFYALLWQRFIAASQAVQCKKGYEQDGAGEMPVFLNILHNIRHMVCDATNYVGNAVSGVYVSEKPSKMLEKPLMEIAGYIKSHINQITPGAVVNITEIAFDPNGNFVLRVLSLLNRFGSGMAISNVSKLAFSSLDFGIGTLAAVICGTKPTEGMSFWMPHVSEDNKGGIDIYFGLQNDIYHEMKNDNLLARYAQFKN